MLWLQFFLPILSEHTQVSPVQLPLKSLPQPHTPLQLPNSLSSSLDPNFLKESPVFSLSIYSLTPHLVPSLSLAYLPPCPPHCPLRPPGVRGRLMLMKLELRGPSLVWAPVWAFKNGHLNSLPNWHLSSVWHAWSLGFHDSISSRYFQLPGLSFCFLGYFTGCFLCLGSSSPSLPC